MPSNRAESAYKRLCPRPATLVFAPWQKPASAPVNGHPARQTACAEPARNRAVRNQVADRQPGRRRTSRDLTASPSVPAPSNPPSMPTGRACFSVGSVVVSGKIMGASYTAAEAKALRREAYRLALALAQSVDGKPDKVQAHTVAELIKAWDIAAERERIAMNRPLPGVRVPSKVSKRAYRHLNRALAARMQLLELAAPSSPSAPEPAAPEPEPSSEPGSPAA